ncbi:hypothetical protein GCM10023259_000350 [Thermocatellispora tengchongensis]
MVRIPFETKWRPAAGGPRARRGGRGGRPQGRRPRPWTAACRGSDATPARQTRFGRSAGRQAWYRHSAGRQALYGVRPVRRSLMPGAAGDRQAARAKTAGRPGPSRR